MKRESVRRKDADAAQLRARGWQYDQIARELGYAGPSGAHAAVSRALKESVRLPVDEARELALVHLDELARKAWEIVRARHVAVSAGRVVRLDDEPVIDVRPVLEAMNTVLRIEQRRAALLGLDAPRKSAVNVITLDAVDAEIARLDAEISARGTPPSD